ncbi:hypothetical protein [Bacillus sp. FJAT-22090]|uniref:hypothetical protein n=1 Tax=Bacillus sp. FJAT-22090 TaxID=1581038 RepID=UPI0011AA4214|nr:hypothetical protein [Bacillus sp. FJAT-22090]
MTIKIGLANGGRVYYQNGDKTMDDITKALNDNQGIDVNGTTLYPNDIAFLADVDSEDVIDDTLKTIQTKSHELAFNRGKSTKNSYIVPVYVAVELDEKTGTVKDIRLDGVKDYLLKHI